VLVRSGEGGSGSGNVSLTTAPSAARSGDVVIGTGASAQGAAGGVSIRSGSDAAGRGFVELQGGAHGQHAGAGVRVGGSAVVTGAVARHPPPRSTLAPVRGAHGRRWR
jgi:hypothetical protein